MSHSLDILRKTLSDYLEELHRCEAQKQYHLKTLKAYGQRQNEIQEVIDDLRKTLDSMEKNDGFA